MRQIRIAVAVVAAHVALSAHPQEKPNLVRNPGFEEVEAERPVHWELSGKAKLDNAQFHAGRMGLCMRHEALDTSRAWQTVRCGGRGHVALVRVKVDEVKGAGARVRLLGPSGQVIAASKPLTGESIWHVVRLPFNPGSSRDVRIELALEGASGAVWFDDAIVGEAEQVARLLKPGNGELRPDNLALGRPYELSPPPSYKYCTDPGDIEQLTDGKYTVGYFWTQKSTVGWYLYSPQITVDLGRVQPISGIMINCPGGGAAGVKFPVRITYLVSDDNEMFSEVVELKPQGLKQDGKTWYTHRFLADGLRTRGRYVMVRLEKAGSTVFADEIEIYKGDFDPTAVTVTGEQRSRLAMAFGQYSITPQTYRPGHFPETPHVKWAKPLAGGPLKAILMAYSGDMRDVVEIAQRLDLDYVPVQHFSYYRATTLGMLMQEQIADALPDCEVMVVGGLRWQAMPRELVERIKARVAEGMGLVCVTPIPVWLKPVDSVFRQDPIEGDNGILDLVPMTLIPAYRKPRRSHFHLANCGAGRVAWVNWGELTRGGHSLLPGFELGDLDDDATCGLEYAFAAFSKLILWAAGRDVTRLTNITDAIEVEVGPVPTPAKLEVLIRDPFFQVEARREFDVPTAGGRFSWPRPDGLVVGAHPVDVTLRDLSGRILDFGSTRLDVDGAVRIEALTLDKPFYTPGDVVRVTAKIAMEEPRRDLRLQARLFDTYDREIAAPVSAAVADPGDTALTLGPIAPLTLGAKLNVRLVATDDIERRFERVWIDLPEEDDYTVCAWYAWDRQPAAYYGMQMLDRLGIDTYVSLAGKWRAENAAWGNLRHGPENVERVYPRNKDDSVVRVPCLTDPAYRARTAARIEKLAAEVRPFGVLEWSFGDESTLGRRDYCHSPTCLDAFRAYLKDQYGTVAALNEGWGAELATWSDVVPATRVDVEKRENIAPWLDHRRYMERLFAEYHAWLGTLVTRHIPQAKVGISGTPGVNSSSGHDWWLLMQTALTHLSSYGGIQRDLQRSFKRPGTFVSSFLGYDYKDNNEQRARHSVWDLVFHGSNGVNYYTLMSNTLNCPLIRPDMSLTRKAPWFFEELKELKAGFGRLFMSADYENDGIAIHYSPASIHTATATGLFDHRDRLRNYNINLSNVHKILTQCHFQVDLIHEEQMARGELSRYRLLVLPWAMAVSGREAAAIREFVQNGGTVLADCACGIRNGHGKPQRMLDDLFGVRQTLARPALQPETLEVAATAADERFSAGPVPVASGCAEVEVTTGIALARGGGAPALIVNRAGRGKAIFLNCCFSNYAEVWSGGVGGEVLEERESPQNVTAPIRRFIAQILSAAGVRKAVSVRAERGLSTDIELARFRSGRVRLYGVLRSITAGRIDRSDLLPYELALDEAAHIYEARSGRYLGKTDRITDHAPRGMARVFAALPYHVVAVEMRGSASAQCGEPFRVEIAARRPGSGTLETHLFHLSVAGPDGKERRWYAKNVVGLNGRAPVEIPFAHNDPPGNWQLTATDVMTGTQGSLSVILKRAAALEQ